MMRISIITLNDISGKTYKFRVYPLDHKFPPLGAVYYIYKRTMSGYDNGTHTASYVGQSGNILVRFANRHKQSCLDKHGPNSICLHVDNNETSRLDKEWDLLNALQARCNG